jgi:tetratricopeptide (TPR) repeat protein
MRLWSVPPLLVLVGFFLTAPMLRAGNDPGGDFLQAYQAYQVAAKLEVNGKLDDALSKYRFCASLLEQIQKENPDFNPPVIEFRLKKSRESIVRVQSLATPAPVAARPESASTPAPPPVPVQRPLQVLLLDVPEYRIPVPGAPAASRGSEESPAPRDFGQVAGADDVVGRGKLAEVLRKMRALQFRLDAEKQENSSLRDQLLQYKANEQSALTERDRTKVRVVELEAQLSQAQQTLDDTQHENDRLLREKATDGKRIAGLESDLTAARADLEVANEYNGELFAKLEKAAQFIEVDEGIRKQLLAERKELSGRLASGAGQVADADKARVDALASRDSLAKKLAESEKEKTAALTRLDAVEKQLTESSKARDAALARNGLLVKQLADSAKQQSAAHDIQARLEETEKKLADLAEKDSERAKVEGDLRQQLDTANQSLASLRTQLDAGRGRIAELEKQLTDTSRAAATATGAMARENTLLKSLISRELEEQAKRQQARKLVEEEMEKLKVRSTALLGKLDALGSAEVTLTPEERKVLPRAAAVLKPQSDFVFVVPQKKPESDLPADLVSRAREANALSQEGRFDEARTIYEELARKAPKSYFAAVNLGIVQRQLGDYAQAAEAFQRALDLQPNDAYALTNLGSAQYRGGDLSAAIATLRKAVSADGDNYLTHYLLGTALNDNGERDAARREIERTLTLKPDYLPAVQLGSEIDKADLSSAKTSGSAPAAH